jgi:hypothetical protein
LKCDRVKRLEICRGRPHSSDGAHDNDHNAQYSCNHCLTPLVMPTKAIARMRSRSITGAPCVTGEARFATISALDPGLGANPEKGALALTLLDLERGASGRVDKDSRPSYVSTNFASRHFFDAFPRVHGDRLGSFVRSERS